MPKPKMVICLGSSCYARGNAKNLEAIERFLAERHLEDEVDIDLSGGLCTGNCAEGPIVLIDGRVYKRVDPGALRDMLNALFPEKKQY